MGGLLAACPPGRWAALCSVNCNMFHIELPATKRLLHRMYVDEVGNHAMKESLNENERFLTLFGVWTDFDHMVNVIQPEMHAIKLKFFQSDPDSPVIFHRKDISRYRGPFSILYGDEKKRKQFGDRMLRAYEEWQYTAAVVTIDKTEHLSRYQVWRHAPYHYCLEVLLERYVLYLHYRELRGDVMIESRNTTLDEKLESSFRRLYTDGTRHVPANIIQKCLTSKELKLKKKSANIAGLQLADLLAHSAHYDLLLECGFVEQQKSQYGQRIADILNGSKHNREMKAPLSGCPMYSGDAISAHLPPIDGLLIVYNRF